MAVAEEAIGAANMVEIASGTRAIDDEHAVGLHDIAQQTAVVIAASTAAVDHDDAKEFYLRDHK